MTAGFRTTAAVEEASSDGVDVSFRRSFFLGSQLSSPWSTLAILGEVDGGANRGGMPGLA